MPTLVDPTIFRRSYTYCLKKDSRRWNNLPTIGELMVMSLLAKRGVSDDGHLDCSE